MAPRFVVVTELQRATGWAGQLAQAAAATYAAAAATSASLADRATRHWAVATLLRMPAPSGPSLWLLAASLLAAALRGAFVAYWAQRICALYGQTREVKKDM